MAGATFALIFAASSDLRMAPAGAQQPPPPDVPPPPNVIVTPDRLDGYQQPVMAEDPVRPGHLAIAYQEAHSLATCFLAQSDDGGATWSNLRLAGKNSQLTLPAGAFCWNPTLAFGPDGALYYAFQTGFYFNQGDRRVLLTVSRDDGATFSPPAPVSTQPDANQFWPGLAVDPEGRLFVSFTRSVFGPNAAGPIAVVTSDDGGRTFSPPLPTNPAHALSLGSVLTAGEDGLVYVAYLDQGTNPFGADPDLIVGVSSDRGLTFDTTSFGPSVGGCLGTSGRGFDRLHGDGPCRLITIETSKQPGEAFAAWWDERGPENRARVVLARTTDGGSNWSTPAVVGVPEGREADHQHRPWLAAAPDGRLHLVYYNREGKDQDGPQHVYLASSTDGGTTFETPQLLSDVPSDSRVGPTGRVPGGFASLGDFIAAVPLDGGVGAAWTDMRRGNTDNGKQDIVFALAGSGAVTARKELGAGDEAAPAATAPAATARAPQLPATGGSGLPLEAVFAFITALFAHRASRATARAAARALPSEH